MLTFFEERAGVRYRGAAYTQVLAAAAASSRRPASSRC